MGSTQSTWGRSGREVEHTKQLNYSLYNLTKHLEHTNI